MITKIDHIGISSITIESHIAVLEKLGYSLMFHEKGVPNPTEKKSVLLNYAPLHDLALLTSNTGIGIEFLDHGVITETISPMSLVLTGVNNQAYKSVREVMICDKTYTEAILSMIPCRALVLKHDGPYSCKGVCVNVRDINKSIEFWKWFGCKVVEADQYSAHLTFKEFLTKNTWSIYLVLDTKHSSIQYMDGSGINSVAFVSSSAITDKEALTALGYITTPIYYVRVNGRLLSVLFIRGPSGENIEIISPVNKNADVNCIN